MGKRFHHRRGFTLLELAIVLALVGLMAGFALKVADSTIGESCNQKTQAQLERIQSTIENYVRTNNRYPKPAWINYGSNNADFGKEATDGIAVASSTAAYGTSIPNNGTAMRNSGGVLIGMLPFATLGLNANDAADCWGAKFVYEVTNVLTSSDSTSGYPASGTAGAITLNTGTIAAANAESTSVAYVVYSTGANRRGAATMSANDISYTFCAGAAAGNPIDQENCDGDRVVFNSVFNNGDSAGANFFDDLLIFSTKNLKSNLYCWGAYPAATSFGLIGTATAATTTCSSTGLCYTQPHETDGGILFSSLSRLSSNFGGNASLCAVGQSGYIYCWGKSLNGVTGQGNSTDVLVPTRSRDAGTGTADTRTYTSVAVGERTACGIESGTSQVYCWGIRRYSGINDSAGTLIRATLTNGGTTFASLWPGPETMCGIRSTGQAYCWGHTTSHLGVGAPVSYVPNAIPTAGSMTFSKLVSSDLTAAAGDDYTCGLRADGLIYCWGDNSVGQLGNSTTTTSATPVATTGGFTYTALETDGGTTCALRNNGNIYCWGKNDALQTGNNSGTTPITAPTQITSNAAYNGLFTGLMRNGTGFCGRTSGGALYCWGNNSSTNMGNGGAAGLTLPLAGKVSGTTVFRANPNPGSLTNCALSTTNELYCWGSNNNGQIGTGSTAATGTTPGAVAGVWQDVFSNGTNTCALE